MIDRSPIQEFSLVTKPKAHLLVIYTGGTLGMDYDEKGSLIPCPFDQVIERVPVIKELNINLSVTSFNEPLDSSMLVCLIGKKWQKSFMTSMIVSMALSCCMEQTPWPIQPQH